MGSFKLTLKWFKPFEVAKHIPSYKTLKGSLEPFILCVYHATGSIEIRVAASDSVCLRISDDSPRWLSISVFFSFLSLSFFFTLCATGTANLQYTCHNTFEYRGPTPDTCFE
jgi:hypothetical protein